MAAAVVARDPSTIQSVGELCAGYTPAKRRAELAKLLPGKGKKQQPVPAFTAEDIEKLTKRKRRIRAGAAFPIENSAAKLHREVRAELDRLEAEKLELQEDVPSRRWFLDADEDGAEFPPGRVERRARHGSRMILSAISGRYTPPYNLSDEDHLDAMTEREAFFYNAPGSCGSVVSWRQV
jgi:hypothetical protein